jgi:NAD-dependent DNA ligase
MSPNQAARLLIMSAYLYYRCDSPVLTDDEYDKLSMYVAKHWDKLTPQLQWQLGDPDAIRATGSGILITQMGQSAAHNWHQKKTGKYGNWYVFKWKKRHETFRCKYAVI